MPYSLHEFFFSCLALLTLPVFFVAPGYAAASMTGLMRFREQGWIERALWAVALSQPISLLFAVHPLLRVSPRMTTGFFVVLSLAACGLVLRDVRRDGLRKRLWWDRSATIGAWAAGLLVVYCVLAALPLEFHGRLYESAMWQDWNVRLQLVNSAIRGGYDLRNPMFAPGGDPAPLRYYYFWYVLCARMHDLAPVSARAVLTASCAGASLSIMAFLFLALKYLGDAGRAVRSRSVAILVAACILGMDLPVAIVMLMRHRVYANLQFWLEDRTPRLLHILLWAPHHAAGLACCGLGTLLVIHCLDVSPRQRLVHTVLAGVCFAAAVGTSTYIMALFVSALAFIFVDALLRRQWSVVLGILGAGILSVLLDFPYLLGLVRAPAGSVSDHSGLPLLRPLPRFMNQSLRYIWMGMDAYGQKYLHRHIHPTQGGETGWVMWELRLLHRPLVLALGLMDLGFFAFVVVWQARKDFLSATRMPRDAWMLWLIFIGIAVPGTRLTSAALQNNNDFARHAGLCMEMVLLLWAAPLIADFWSQRRAARRNGRPMALSTATRWAVACAAIGLAGQAVQIALDRVRMPLTDANLLPHVVVAEHIPHTGYRFDQIRLAMEAAARVTPPMGIVQIDPHSRLGPVFLLYTARQSAASDDGCNTPFGGDPRLCPEMTQSLIDLFGGTGGHYYTDLAVIHYPVEFDPQWVTPENFARVCAENKLDVLVADYTDPVWWTKTSWVWKLKPVYANSTAKVFRCGAGS